MMSNARAVVRVPAAVDGTVGSTTAAEPVVLRSLNLQRQRADDILNGLLRHDVVPFEHPERMQKIARKADATLVMLAADRASSNPPIVQ